MALAKSVVAAAGPAAVDKIDSQMLRLSRLTFQSFMFCTHLLVHVGYILSCIFYICTCICCFMRKCQSPSKTQSGRTDGRTDVRLLRS